MTLGQASHFSPGIYPIERAGRISMGPDGNFDLRQSASSCMYGIAILDRAKQPKSVCASSRVLNQRGEHGSSRPWRYGIQDQIMLGLNRIADIKT